MDFYGIADEFPHRPINGLLARGDRTARRIRSR